MKTKLCRPVLIDSIENSKIGLYQGKLYRSGFGYNCNDWKNKQLILISLDPNEKIEGEDQYVTEDGELKQTYNMTHKKCSCKKVIATQSQLSPEYIQQFIEQYNNGKVEDVEIKVFHDWSTDIEPGVDPIINSTFTNKPKLTNGFITIAEKEYNIPYPTEPVEEDGELIYLDHKKSVTYSEEEFVSAYKQGAIDYCRSSKGLQSFLESEVDVWFNQNKK